MREDLVVPVEKLRRVCKPADFSFENTDELPLVDGFIGQDKALQALNMGLEIDSHEHNIYIVNDTGISGGSVLLHHLKASARQRAPEEILLKDFCYVHNFEKPGEPKVLTFEKGQGRLFAKRIQGVLSSAQKSIPNIFKSDECSAATNSIRTDADEKSKKLFDAIVIEAGKAHFDLFPRQSGYVVNPLSNLPGAENQPMSNEEYNGLPEEKRKLIDENRKNLNGNLLKVLKKIQSLHMKALQEINDLERTLISRDFLKRIFENLLRRYSDYPEAVSFLDGLQNYTLENINLFKEEQRMPLPDAQPNGSNGSDPFLPFKVNVLIDNGNADKMPVIFESNPTFGNLFGRIEKKFTMGGFFTDHTLLKAGSLLLAEGGYLVLSILDVLKNPGVWEKLEKIIRYGYLKIEESPASYFGHFPAPLDPEQIPVRLKVILVGELRLYQLLVEYDSEFSAIFKIKVELDTEMPATQTNMMAYAGFIALCCGKEDPRRRKDNLLPFDRSAVAKITEYGLRLAGGKEKLSTEFNRVKDLIVESDHLAGKAGSNVVKAEHVMQAQYLQRSRANLMEGKIHELIKEEMLLIDTKERKVGQINGLSVYMLGDYSFGMPCRITAETYLGRRGVVSIDREVKMSGPIHDKGVNIFSGYFHAKYGKDKPISFSSSICFEQSYHGVEGDSASAAELFCLISSLSGLLIKQSLAVTGSVNQKGEIQPIGGVNQKIEGFFDVCRERGLTGEQGVIIPHQNIKNLMLREDVVEACGEGKFRVIAIKTVDEGLELLMGASASEINRKVDDRLSEMTGKIKESKEANRE